MDQGMSYDDGGSNVIYPTRRSSMTAPQQTVYGWAPQPMPTLYQLVPVDSSYFGYPSVYPQPSPSSQPVQSQSQQTTYYAAYPPPMAMNPTSPTRTAFMTPVSPMQRHVSYGLTQSTGGDVAYYPHQAPQPAPCQPVHGYQQIQQPPPLLSPSQQPQFQATASVSPAVDLVSASADNMQTFHISPTHRTSQSYVHEIAAVTPPARYKAVDMTKDVPLAPNTVPRLGARPLPRLMRTNKPKPLSLNASTFYGIGARSVSQPLPMAHNVAMPSLTPIGSDREYDGGGSSYSTSPLGSEYHRESSGLFGMVSETSEGSEAQRRFVERLPRVTKYVRTQAMPERVGENKDESLLSSATPHVLSHEQDTSSLQQFIEERVKERHNKNQKYTSAVSDSDGNNGGKCGRSGMGAMISSSDEWYTTTDTNPIRRRHRHRVASGDEREPQKPSMCSCGMHQCCVCGLFISRPGSHVCMHKTVSLEKN